MDVHDPVGSNYSLAVVINGAKIVSIILWPYQLLTRYVKHTGVAPEFLNVILVLIKNIHIFFLYYCFLQCES